VVLLLTEKMEEQPELSLGMTSLEVSVGFGKTRSPAKSSSSDSHGSRGGKKRKQFAWDEAISRASSLDLQLGDPLPLDWEQCLDLHVSIQIHLKLFVTRNKICCIPR
jgi:hypothetical protein